MLIDITAIITGFVVLMWSADRFILGAATTARNFNIPPLVIGITVVGFGTSAPEMMVALFSSINESPAMAIGNAIGSNIANIALVLGVAAMLVPLTVQSSILKKEFPLLLLSMILMLALIVDNHLGRLDGFILFGTLIALMWWITHQALQKKGFDPMEEEYEKELPGSMPMRKALFWLVAGIILLSASSKLLVWGAVNIAVSFGISELIIGLTIIAVGTSLPELAASVAGVMKKEHDIAIGNIVGSNMFNTLAVLGIPGMIAPSILDDGVLSRDVPIVFILTIALFIMAYGFRGPGKISRIEGALLLTAFIGYQILLYTTALSN